MKAILSMDAGLVEVIDLKPYIRPQEREIIAKLYKLHHWDFREEWVWVFEDVCALYFRAQRHKDIFGEFPAQVKLLSAIEASINDCQEDEFS